MPNKTALYVDITVHQQDDSESTSISSVRVTESMNYRLRVTNAADIQHIRRMLSSFRRMQDRTVFNAK